MVEKIRGLCIGKNRQQFNSSPIKVSYGVLALLGVWQNRKLALHDHLDLFDSFCKHGHAEFCAQPVRRPSLKTEPPSQFRGQHRADGAQTAMAA